MTESSSNSDHLEVTDVLAQLDVSESAPGGHAKGQQAANSTPAHSSAPAQTPTSKANNSFDIVFALSSERQAALRERKIYKDRAAAAEARIVQLESDLSATQALAKVQSDAVNANDTIATLKRLLQERDNRISQLESQLADQAGAPTLVGGELERIAAGINPKVVYALESLENATESYKLTRPTTTVGRSKDNDIYLASTSVSRFHARLVNKADGLWLLDQQSVNGCRVNGKRTTSQILNDGDLVMIGHCRFRVSTSDS